MTPIEICKTVIGDDKLQALLADISSPQLKKILKEGGLKSKVAGGYVSVGKKRKTYTTRILTAIEQDNGNAASEFLQQWLLNHRREMLTMYLDELGVRHQAGETEDNFLFSNTPEQLKAAAAPLFEKFERTEVAAYLLYIAYQQHSNAFEGWSAVTFDEPAAD